MKDTFNKGWVVSSRRWRVHFLGVLFLLAFVFVGASIAAEATENTDVPAPAHDIQDILSTINTEKEKPIEFAAEAPQKTIPPPIDPPPEKESMLNRFFMRLNRDTTWGGYLRNETAYRIVRPDALTKIRNTIQVEARSRLTHRISLSGRVNAFYDAVYDVESISVIHPRKGPDQILEDNLTGDAVAALNAANPREVEIVQDRVELKELFLDFNYQNIDIRVGKQIVRWGVVEGARVLDEINPL
ncbi:MAG: DUF1302 family protein, partial [Nitrospiria bacterium]